MSSQLHRVIRTVNVKFGISVRNSASMTEQSLCVLYMYRVGPL